MGEIGYRVEGASAGGTGYSRRGDCRVQCLHCAVIAECRRAQQVAQGGGSVTGSALPPGWWVPTCKLFDMLAFQLSGFLGSWKAGGVD